MPNTFRGKIEGLEKAQAPKVKQPKVRPKVGPKILRDIPSIQTAVARNKRIRAVLEEL